MKNKILTYSFIFIFIISITPQLHAQAPDNVWVDDDYNSSTAGWDSTHFNVIQKAVTAVAEAGTVEVDTGI